MSAQFDVLILGGGLVGNALACALDGSGWRVGLVEATASSAAAPGFDERKLALADASLNALSALGVLPLLATPPAPIQRLHISREGDFGAVRLAAGDYGRAAFGGVVLARELGLALTRRVEAHANVSRFCPARVTSISLGGDSPQVRIAQQDGESTLSARLVVGCDGTQSMTRAAAGIACEVHDYGQTLFVCSVRSEKPADGTGWERFSAQGPVAMLPMHGGHYGSICGVASEDAERVAGLSDALYLDYLQQRFGWRLGRLLQVGKRSAYPIQRVLAERLTAPRTALLGNAAQTLHPIGAQGFNLGLRDALALARLLRGVDDPGAPVLLSAYEQARREDREQTLAFSDGLARFTANDSAGLRLLRSLGLFMLNRLPGASDALVAGAMGYRGQVDALSRVAS